MPDSPRLGAQGMLYRDACETARAARPLPRRQIAPQHFFERLDLGAEAFAQPALERGLERGAFGGPAPAKAEAQYAAFPQHDDRKPGVALVQPSLNPPGPLGEQRDAWAVRHAV